MPLSPVIFRIAQAFVVRADEDNAASNDDVAVSLRAELGHPLTFFFVFTSQLDRQTLHVGDHVAIGRAAPHGPVARAGIGSAAVGSRQTAGSSAVASS